MSSDKIYCKKCNDLFEDTHFYKSIEKNKTRYRCKLQVKEASAKRHITFLKDEILPLEHFCKRCKTTHPTSEFKVKNINNSDRIYLECKLVKSGRKFDKGAKSHTEEYERERKLISRYGINLIQYEEIFNNQNGKCLICNVHSSECKRPLVVDHCHETNKIRGLLCYTCNLSIGSFEDNIDFINAAIDYLKTPTTNKHSGLIKNEDYKIVNKNREQLLRTNYRITLEDFNRVLEAQNGVCAICNRPESLGDSRWNKTRNLAVDHCHNTHQVRGLLCQACNTSIGLIGDSVETLNNAINYLNN